MFILSVDKYIVVFQIPEDIYESSYYWMILNFMSDMSKEGHKLWKVECATKLAVKLSNGHTLLIQAGTAHKRLYVKFEFNPTKLDADEWEEVRLYMNLLIDVVDGYQKLHEDCRVNYIEFAADTSCLEFDSIFVYDEKLRGANEGFHERGSIYLGSKKSTRRFCIYDKTKELKDKQGIILDHKLVRFEARLSNLKMTSSQLHSLPNPFSSFRVGLISELLATKGDGVWETFKTQSQSIGVQNALVSSGKHRKQIKAQLAEIARPEWNPGQCWDQLPKALEILKPPKVSNGNYGLCNLTHPQLGSELKFNFGEASLPL